MEMGLLRDNINQHSNLVNKPCTDFHCATSVNLPQLIYIRLNLNYVHISLVQIL